MPEAERGAVTRLLNDLRAGHRDAFDTLLPLVYNDLRRRAAAYLRRERAGHTLQPTALVHEAYLRLVDQREMNWQDRAHFFAIAAQAMRRILVDHARSHHRGKRGGGAQPEMLDESSAVTPARSIELLAVDQALTRLEARDAQQSRLVELRYFAGLSIEETADVLGISPSTVKREWSVARAWLFAAISGMSTTDVGA